MAQISIGPIFVSYSRRDEAVMQRIAMFLRKQGINVWVDNEKLIPGTDIWEEEIEKAIRSAFAVVVILSPHSKKSIWVRREISFAERYHKRIFPVMVAGDEDSSITLRLTTSQYVDIRKNEEIGLVSLGEALSVFYKELEAEKQKAREKAKRRAHEKAERMAAAKIAHEETEHEAQEKLAREQAEPVMQEIIEKKPQENVEDAEKTATPYIEPQGQSQEPSTKDQLGWLRLLKSIPAYIYFSFLCFVSCLALGVLVEGDIKDVEYSPDGSVLYVIRSDEVYRYKASDLKLISSPFGYPGTSFYSLALSPDGQIVATGLNNGSILLWQAAQLQTLEGHKKIVESVAFSGNGEILASGSDDDTVRLWHVSEGKLLRTLEGHSADVNSVAFSPDGQLIASGSDDKSIRIWRVSDGALLLVLEGHAGQVESVAFSPDGEFLASGSWDKTIRLWRISDGSQLPPIEIHSGYVLCLSFSTDGEILASGGSDNVIRLWNAHARTLLYELKGHWGDISSVAFSPDGETLASGSSDDTARLWRVSDGTIVQKLDWKFRNPFNN